MKTRAITKAANTTTTTKLTSWAGTLGMMTMTWLAMAAAAGCGEDGNGVGTGAGTTAPAADRTALHAVIGAAGGELIGDKGTPFEGVHLTIPPNALTANTELVITRNDSPAQPLPSTAVGCGPLFALEPAGLPLAVPATLVLPVDNSLVSNQFRFADEVKVWAAAAQGWTQRLQTDSTDTTVTVSLDALTQVEAGVNPPADQDEVNFEFKPNPKFLPCLAQYPDDPDKAPSVQATVVRGDLNDGLFLRGKNIKPGLKFDMFTVEHSALDATGKPDPAFQNFGLAWYQSDLEAKDSGSMRASIRTILLDQIFGFDPTVTLPPTGTFEVGFWFNNPADAAACGFDVTKPTPFNGEHQAGPLAMITLPNATTGLGPLCTKPDTSVTPARCSP